MPDGYVGVKYEIEIASEEGSGCEPYDYFELVNSVLPPGLLRTREGVISGVPTVAGATRFWLWNRDQTFAQGASRRRLNAHTGRRPRQLEACSL